MEKENKKNTEIKEENQEKDSEAQENEEKGEKSAEKGSEIPVPAKPTEKKAEPKKAKKGRQRLSITVIRITANYAENETEETQGPFLYLKRFFDFDNL